MNGSYPKLYAVDYCWQQIIVTFGRFGRFQLLVKDTINVDYQLFWIV